MDGAQLRAVGKTLRFNASSARRRGRLTQEQRGSVERDEVTITEPMARRIGLVASSQQVGQPVSEHERARTPLAQGDGRPPRRGCRQRQTVGARGRPGRRPPHSSIRSWVLANPLLLRKRASVSHVRTLRQNQSRRGASQLGRVRNPRLQTVRDTRRRHKRRAVLSRRKRRDGEPIPHDRVCRRTRAIAKTHHRRAVRLASGWRRSNRRRTDRIRLFTTRSIPTRSASAGSASGTQPRPSSSTGARRGMYPGPSTSC